MDINDMNAALGEQYARGEFETCIIDGEEVERQIRQRGYGLLLVEYRYPDGRPSRWGIRLPRWPEEMLMSTAEAKDLHGALALILERS